MDFSGCVPELDTAESVSQDQWAPPRSRPPAEESPTVGGRRISVRAGPIITHCPTSSPQNHGEEHARHLSQEEVLQDEEQCHEKAQDTR